MLLPPKVILAPRFMAINLIASKVTNSCPMVRFHRLC